MSGVEGAGSFSPEQIAQYKKEVSKVVELFEKSLDEYEKTTAFHKREKLRDVMDKSLSVVHDISQEVLKEELAKLESKLSRDYKDFTEAEDGMMTRMHIESADRPGLLDIIARTLINLDIRLHNAKVSTAGEKAVDYFDLTNKTTKEPLTAELQEQLKQALLEKL